MSLSRVFADERYFVQIYWSVRSIEMLLYQLVDLWQLINDCRSTGPHAVSTGTKFELSAGLEKRPPTLDWENALPAAVIRSMRTSVLLSLMFLTGADLPEI